MGRKGKISALPDLGELMETNIIQSRQHNGFVSAENPPICTQCAMSGASCCRLAGVDDIVAPISAIEWQQILAVVPWAGEPGFVIEEENTPAFVQQMELLFPHLREGVIRAFPLGFSHLRTGVNELGQCAFLGPMGCSLARSIRPAFCHVYPFWFNGDQLQVFSDPGCLALREAATVEDLCQLLATTPERIRRHYVRLCQGWGVTPARLR